MWKRTNLGILTTFIFLCMFSFPLRSPTQGLFSFLFLNVVLSFLLWSPYFIYLGVQRLYRRVKAQREHE